MTAIRVEGLGKKYVIGHLGPRPGGSLREAITESFRSVGRVFAPGPDPDAGRPYREEFWALSDISFRVEEGERVGIIGRNGAGKSTLLKILSRITPPTRGQVRLRGRLASLLEVGTGFHHELTGRENVYLNGAILGMRHEEVRRKFDEIVSFAEVERFLDTPVKHYSSGMYVRLAFAVAAHLEPEILVVDEVLAVGDVQFQAKCLGKMEEAGGTGRTVLFVSHNLAAVRALCGRAILLDRGTLVADGNPGEVTARYLRDLRGDRVGGRWDDEGTAPQNHSAVLRRVSVVDDLGEPLDRVDTDTPFRIEVEYRVKAEGTSMGLTAMLYDGEGACAFSSINNHEPNWYGKPMRQGVYRSACRVPAGFLNDGWYTVTLILFGRGFSDACTVQNAVRLEVHDAPSVRGDFFGVYAGCIRPLLEWKTSRVGE
jgi:lipopolysaccharide transport system ATP-binding protein